MKITSIKRLMKLTVVSLFLFPGAFAQQKNAHVNSDAILALMPEAKLAQFNLEAFGKTKSEEIDKMQKEYQIKYEAAVAKNKTLSEANKDLVVKELQTMSDEMEQLKRRIDDAVQNAQKAVAAKQAELLSPVNLKFMNALRTVYKEKGLSYVFDIANAQNSNLLLWDAGIDITEEVKLKLGLSSAAPGETKK